MNFNDIIKEYYTLYRGDTDIPTTGDDEWTIGLRLANNAVRRWAQVDGVLWNELWTDTATEGDTLTVITDTSSYEFSGDMKFPGGWVKVSSGEREQILDVVPLNDIQRMSDTASYAYFTGNSTSGFTLHLSIMGTPSVDYNGWEINFPYYKNPTTFSDNETGTTEPDMSEPYFIVHDMLANRFRASRNWPAYQTAKRDADESLRNMINRNAMGVPGSPWTINDHSNGSFGI